jgi:hypothetical protein
MKQIHNLEGYQQLSYYSINVFYKISKLYNNANIYLAHALIFEEFKLKYLKYSFDSMHTIARQLNKSLGNAADSARLHYIYELKGGIKFLVDSGVYNKTIEQEENIQIQYKIKLGTCALVINKNKDKFIESLVKLNSIVNFDQRLNTIVSTTFEEAIDAIKANDLIETEGNFNSNL